LRFQKQTEKSSVLYCRKTGHAKTDH